MGLRLVEKSLIQESLTRSPTWVRMVRGFQRGGGTIKIWIQNKVRIDPFTTSIFRLHVFELCVHRVPDDNPVSIEHK
jgi:hypothetical protein